MRSALTFLAVAALVGGCASTKYYEHEKDGRIYVVGSKESSDKFAKNGHLPYTRTLVGAGPNRETVVFEVDKKDAALANRLEKQYRKKHKLPARK